MISRAFAGLGLTALLVAGIAAQGQEQGRQNDPSQQADIQALVAAVDELAADKAAPGTLPLAWAQHHFIKSQGDRTYVPFTVTIEPAVFTASTPVGLYLRVVSRGGAEGAQAPPAPAEGAAGEAKQGQQPRPQYPFEDVFFFNAEAAQPGQPNVFRRAFAVPPGDYDVYVALKARGGEAPAPAGTAGSTPPAEAQESTAPPAEAPRVGVLKHQLTVPALEGGELETSSVIVAETVEVLQQPIPNEQQAEHPYTFGQMRIVPSLDSRFTKADELSVIFWIYNAALDPATKKPDLQVEFEFHQKTGEGEKYFNKTEPQVLNAETLPAEFDLAAGHQLPGSLAVPLASFPEGEYRLAIAINDKVGGTTTTRDVNFTVAGAQQP